MSRDGPDGFAIRSAKRATAASWPEVAAPRATRSLTPVYQRDLCRLSRLNRADASRRSKLDAVFDIDGGQGAEIVEPRHRFRVQAREGLQYAAPNGALGRSLGCESVQVFHVDDCKGEVVVCQGGAVVGLFDAPDDAFAELHPHAAFALFRHFFLVLSVLSFFCGVEHCGDTVVFVIGGASGFCWCWGGRHGWSVSGFLRDGPCFKIAFELSAKFLEPSCIRKLRPCPRESQG